jgi:imidazolonepropionase-like amidohydrolase
MNNIPRSFNSLGSRQENATLLRKAGVTVALIGNGGGGEEVFNVRNLRHEAGNAVAYGLSWDEALRAVTRAPAEIFAVADRVGALAPGLEGNVVVWSGDPFEFASYPEHVLVRGREHRAASRQDLLIQRYRTLPPGHTAP